MVGENHVDCKAGCEIITGNIEQQSANDNKQIIQLTVSGGSDKSIKGNNMQESRTSKEMQMASKSLQKSSESCCADKDSAESGVGIIQDKNIIEVGEVQENA
ncbi:hypothetical protein Lalb_Chr25g0285951 [Lupinus albus]|uniref:Uncharacterized protein n=1 Tax=Lupinus albus TaxID=3870 RepID=A0A6A4NCY4_LUPAL|nr:hypothetical protein Lalb_Chr25g0285951 [Lupinus albus]